MFEINKYTVNGENNGKINLPESLFNHSAKNPNTVLYEVVNSYLANQRQGTSSVKGRSEVRGSGRKIYRQKGTGNARMGNNRTPIRIGGGRAFGPKPKDWSRKIPKKKKRLALKIALSQKAENGEIFFIDKLDFEKPETKKAEELINKIIPEKGKKLVLMKDSNRNVLKSFSNISDVKTNRVDCMHAYEILNTKYLVFTEDSLKIAEEVFS